MPPRKIELGLREKYFDLLKKGKKVADGRLFRFKNGKIYKEKYDGLKYGDILVYHKDLPNGKRTDETFQVKVTDVGFYDDIEKMLKELKLKDTLPGIRSFKSGKEIYEEIYGDKLKNGTMIGFKFEKASNNNTAAASNTLNVTNEKNKNKKLVLKVEKEKKMKNRDDLIMELKEKSDKPKIHDLYVKEPWMTLIKEGLKEVEGRLYKGPVTDYRIGDKLVFIHKDREGKMSEYPTIITKLVKYPDFKSLLFHEKLYRVLPGFPNIRTGNELYEIYYPHKAVKEHGALGITFQSKEKNKNNKDILKSLKDNENVGNVANINTQLQVNNNQVIVNEQQKKVNKALKDLKVEKKEKKAIKDNDKTIKSNTTMLDENAANLDKAIKNPNQIINTALVSSNQIAINVNQKKVNENQVAVTLKGKKKN